MGRTGCASLSPTCCLALTRARGVGRGFGCYTVGGKGVSNINTCLTLTRARGGGWGNQLGRACIASRGGIRGVRLSPWSTPTTAHLRTPCSFPVRPSAEHPRTPCPPPRPHVTTHRSPRHRALIISGTGHHSSPEKYTFTHAHMHAVKYKSTTRAQKRIGARARALMHPLHSFPITSTQVHAPLPLIHVAPFSHAPVNSLPHAVLHPTHSHTRARVHTPHTHAQRGSFVSHSSARTIP